MKVPRGPLTVLRWLAAQEEAHKIPGPDADDPELAHEKRGGWWLGYDRIRPEKGQWLIRHMLLRMTSEHNAPVERWELNEHGREAARTGVVPAAVLEALSRSLRS